MVMCLSMIKLIPFWEKEGARDARANKNIWLPPYGWTSQDNKAAYEKGYKAEKLEQLLKGVTHENT